MSNLFFIAFFSLLLLINIIFLFCRRDPKYLVKPQKEGESNDDYNEKLKKVTPTATRHLILIRHGQYEMKPSEDKNRVLTALGKFLDPSKPYRELIHGAQITSLDDLTGAKVEIS